MESSMEKKTRDHLRLTDHDSDRVARLTVTHRPRYSFYEMFTIRGIQLDRYQPGFVSFSFTVPPRLTDRNGNLAVGAIAGLIDVVGSVVVYKMDVNVSVDVSISYLSTAKLNDDLEINGKLLGRKGAYYGSLVVLMNKATREMIAEGRHSFFSKTRSKI